MPSPDVSLRALDTLWFQVAGTICNIECTHCFISCSPKNHAHEMLSLAEVEARLAEARELGVREYYFTGGEPFMNRDMLPILEMTLKQGPATVLATGAGTTTAADRTALVRSWARSLRTCSFFSLGTM